MGKTCRECHFLAKEYRGAGTSAGHTFSLNAEERRVAPTRPAQHAIICRKGVWDEGIGMTPPSLDAELARKDREDTCFFFPYHAAMLFPAAEELQKRTAENAQLKRSHGHAVVGLWIAALGLVASVVVSIIQLAR